MTKQFRRILVLLMTCAMLMTGCQSADSQTAKTAETTSAPAAAEQTTEGVSLHYEGSLKFTGMAEPFEVAYDDIYAMPFVETSVHSVSSSGEEADNTVKGVLLETILAEHGMSQKDFSTIRLIAGDGYAIDVTADLLNNKDIVLAYEFDGAALEEKEMPLRAAIDDVRSMYYVSNLVEIAAISEGVEAMESVPARMVMLETAYASGIETEPFTYYESEDKSVLMSDLVDAYVSEGKGNPAFKANDGFEKSEDYDVVYNGYLKITGEDAPLFTGKDLPKGMNVKSVMTLGVGDTTFISVGSALAYGQMNGTVGDVEGIKLIDALTAAGIEGDLFKFSDNTGYEVEITKEELASGILRLSDDGTAAAKFDESMPKKYNVKHLLTIEAVAGEATMEAADVSETTDTANVSTEGTDGDAAVELPEWTVTFDGLSDGSFDLTSEKAARKLTLISLHTEHTKNDEKKPNDWEGYRVLEMLEFLHVEDFSALVITAGDGYEVELPKDQIDEDTILAVIKNGEPVKADNLVQLVQNTEFSTTWVKGVVKITVK
ncbi:hypothetical protein KHM83_09445 [Fusibacter paucivorans]|uniref:Oxidoreductase molybdopterin binding domain-containing protein n=1 Tax=Fusibacter paucivorans TaxID=76009 RepID=A0ABS5PPD1_9FIRM|nr:hypothetical protein [Fusibacter paucivorans]MBS7526901.1 hypothetical protein [Fusibacter paucivorans]